MRPTSDMDRCRLTGLADLWQELEVSKVPGAEFGPLWLMPLKNMGVVSTIIIILIILLYKIDSINKEKTIIHINNKREEKNMFMTPIEGKEVIWSKIN